MELNPLLIGAGGWNLLVFLLYGMDKWKAKQNLWRIPEKALLTAGFLGGGFGAACGMLVFHHKVSKWSFRIGVPLGLLLSVAELLMLYQKTIV